jgi:predicted dehydrogenase
MQKVKIGIIGCGHISGAYFSAATKFDILEVVACADINPEAAKAKATEYNVKAVPVEKLLKNPEVEIILNLTVPKAHAEIALRTLEHGKHSYSEKPFGISCAESKKVIASAKTKKLRIGSAPDTFLGGGQQTCRKLIDDGWIGRPVGGTAIFMGYGPERYYHPSPKFFFEKGGGPMFDLGPYYVTALVNLLGPVKRVCAVTTKAFEERTAGPQARIKRERIPVEIATHLAGVLEFENGAVINMITSFDVWKHGHNPIEIYGTEGTLFVPDPNTFGGPIKIARGGVQQVEISECPLSHIYTNNFRSIGAADMAYAIRSGRQHRCSGDLAYHVVEIMESFEKSSAAGKHIDIASTCKRPAALPLGLIEGLIDL